MGLYLLQPDIYITAEGSGGILPRERIQPRMLWARLDGVTRAVLTLDLYMLTGTSVDPDLKIETSDTVNGPWTDLLAGDYPNEMESKKWFASTMGEGDQRLQRYVRWRVVFNGTGTSEVSFRLQLTTR